MKRRFIGSNEGSPCARLHRHIAQSHSRLCRHTVDRVPAELDHVATGSLRADSIDDVKNQIL